MLVLLIEDHRLLAETLIDYLSLADIEVDHSDHGLRGLNLALNGHYDAIILDINLPGLDGLSLCQHLRKTHANDTPVLMLTARDQIADKLDGFEHGADDYLIKPFDNAELVARLKALHKRHRGEVASKRLEVGPLLLDQATQQVFREGQPLSVSPTGFRILRILMRESPKVVSREQLVAELWGDNAPDSDTLRSHLYNLRRAIDQPFQAPLLQTLKGVGLRLITPS